MEMDTSLDAPHASDTVATNVTAVALGMINGKDADSVFSMSKRKGSNQQTSCKEIANTSTAGSAWGEGAR